LIRVIPFSAASNSLSTGSKVIALIEIIPDRQFTLELILSEFFTSRIVLIDLLDQTLIDFSHTLVSNEIKKEYEKRKNE
jgi:hypothetical protein